MDHDQRTEKHPCTRAVPVQFHRARTKPVNFLALAALAALTGTLSPSAWCQSSATNCGVSTTAGTGNYPGQGNGNFFSNFNNSTYWIDFGGGGGASLNGDLNAVYNTMSYNIANMQQWAAANSSTANGGLPCYLELVIVGDFPNARYFSVDDIDTHIPPAQHITDAAMDPVYHSTTGFDTNPFIPGPNGGQPWQSGVVVHREVPLGDID